MNLCKLFELFLFIQTNQFDNMNTFTCPIHHWMLQLNGWVNRINKTQNWWRDWCPPLGISILTLKHKTHSTISWKSYEVLQLCTRCNIRSTKDEGCFIVYCEKSCQHLDSFIIHFMFISLDLQLDRQKGICLQSM